MKVLYLITNNTLADGIAKHILNIAGYFAQHPEMKVEPAVCIVKPEGDLSCALRQAGVKVYCLDCSHGHDWRILRRFPTVLKEFRPDVIHAHVTAMLERVYLHCFAGKLPVVTTTHGIILEDLQENRHFSRRERRERRLGQLFSLNIRKHIYISRGVRDFYRDFEQEVIYNPVDFSGASTPTGKLRNLLGVGPDTPVIGTACRISATKNPHAFTRVMCDVLQQVPDCHAVVCGSADTEELMAELRTVVRQAGVEERFHWLGYRPDAAELTRDLNCFVMTSVAEGFPTALLEAMAAKVPAAFMETSGGMLDVAQLHREFGPLGIVTAAGEEHVMAQGIAALLADPVKAAEYAERAFRLGKQKFDIRIITQQLAEVYREVGQSENLLRKPPVSAQEGSARGDL